MAWRLPGDQRPPRALDPQSRPRCKYVWYSQSGREHLFDLQLDRQEIHDLALETGAEALLTPRRARLAQRLAGRPEGFSDGERLIAGRPHEQLVPRA